MNSRENELRERISVLDSNFFNLFKEFHIFEQNAAEWRNKLKILAFEVAIYSNNYQPNYSVDRTFKKFFAVSVGFSSVVRYSVIETARR